MLMQNFTYSTVATSIYLSVKRMVEIKLKNKIVASSKRNLGTLLLPLKNYRLLFVEYVSF